MRPGKSRSEPRTPEAVGVLGGTFDPVHLGHLHAASEVRRVLRLARVLLVPCAVPPHKQGARLTGIEHRLAMLRLAVNEHRGLQVDPLEIDRGGVSYTIDTLAALASGDPPLRPVFILGMDALLEIETWKDHRRLVREYDLVAVDRSRREADQLRDRLPEVVADRLVRPVAFDDPGRGGRVVHLPVRPVAASSSEVRRLASRGAALETLVPVAVARYIREYHLYQEEAADPRTA